MAAGGWGSSWGEIPWGGNIGGSAGSAGGSQVNLYSFTINLKSKQSRGEHIGMQAFAIGATPAAAQQVLEQQFGSDLSQPPFGGVLVCGPAYTILS